MKIECYNFFFHPLDSSHSCGTKSASIAVNVALTVLSGGIYLVIAALVRSYEKGNGQGTQKAVDQTVAPLLKPIKFIDNGNHPHDFLGLEALVKKQAEELAHLKNLANQNKWTSLQTHEGTGFDWWMFPIDEGSRGQGGKYQLTANDVEQLKGDPKFIENFREGVMLVARSWGWNLNPKEALASNPKTFWANYPIRLRKMLQSVALFGQDDLKQKLIEYIDQFHLRHSVETCGGNYRYLFT